MREIKHIILLLSIFLISCTKYLSTEDTRKFNSENEWILTTMREHYLYRDDMTNSPNLDLTPYSFFNSLLSKRDGKHDKKSTHFYSYIKEKTTQTKAITAELSYGFSASIWSGIRTNFYYFRINYVIKGSPADRAGLKRGDIIIERDGDTITESNIDSGEEVEFCILRGGLNSGEALYINVERSETIEDKPILYHDVISHSGKNIGYLVYNHFTPGRTDDPENDRSYDDNLRSICSNNFVGKGISDFILDLRYNSGGSVMSAQLLASIIAPRSLVATPNIFCKLKDVNDKVSVMNFKLPGDLSEINLDIKRLFILTSNRTASASELIINSFKPYNEIEVIIIGDVTAGKNVASVKLTHEDYVSELHPITHHVYNRYDANDYANGFIPNYTFIDIEINNHQYELGDKREYLLEKVLTIISGEIPTENNTQTLTKSKQQVLLIPSEENKGLIIDINK